jgi:hypothetical protein
MARTATRSRAASTREKLEQKPLVVDLGEVTNTYVMSDHAIQRCQDRGIGVFEAYSALAAPDRIDPHVERDDAMIYVRGDIRVVVANQTVVTVIDRLEDERATPRSPLDPIKAGVMSTRRQNPQVLDEAWALVAHDQEDYRKIEISPALAGKLLALNTHNRPIRQADVADWKRKMLSGEYRPTHQGIALDTNGVLQDGQHRLTAIVELDVPQIAWVAVGMPPDNFTVTDAGRNRTYADVLSLSGEKDAAVLGATVRLVWLYLNKDGLSSATGSGGSMKVSNAMVMDVFTKDAARFREAVKVGGRVRHARMGLTAISSAAGWYLIRRTNTASKTDAFFEGLITGEEIPTGDPRPLLGRKLRNEQDSGRRTHSLAQLGLLIKTWNFWASGAENVRMIVWRKGETMPQVAKAGT